MPVENTKRLLQRLNNGEIEFAIIEGYFDKHIYGHALLSYERFLAVCAGTSFIATYVQIR